MSSRKYASGYQKRQKKQKIDELIQSQKGAMERFIRKESQVSPLNQSLDQGIAPNTSDGNEPNNNETDTDMETIVPNDGLDTENIEQVPNSDDNMDSSSHDANVDTSF